MRRLIFPLLLGLAGAAVLVSLGVWQLQRLAWKEGVLAAIEARIADAPGPLPATPDPVRDQYLPVAATVTFTGESLDVLVSRKQIGAGFRPVAVAVTEDGRRILIDRGFLREGERAAPRPGPEAGAATITGHLLWPDEVDGFTPDPDLTRGIWFARDLPRMASHLGTEPMLVVANAPAPPGFAAEPMPVDISGIPNDHLGYAIQWFGLAAVWLGMTALLLWRIRRRTV
ncbi:MAG TPA: SURF1 family protein [Paracoccaceae bacterium]|nr:SURF1 family protein [Paracoccaceae bacterium]HMO72601.1 SURF1 family protein [Paracoccaceae bacterium]